MRANPAMRLIIPEANRDFVAARLQCNPDWPIGLTDGASVRCAGLSFTGIPAAHETLSRDTEGRHHFLGYVVRFGPWTLYHSGDTLLYDGMAERLRQHAIDIALLPINGREEARRVAGNLNGVQAASLAHAMGARVVIPFHFDMFAFNTASPDAFAAEAVRLGQRCHILRSREAFGSAMLPKN